MRSEKCKVTKSIKRQDWQVQKGKNSPWPHPKEWKIVSQKWGGREGSEPPGRKPDRGRCIKTKDLERRDTLRGRLPSVDCWTVGQTGLFLTKMKLLLLLSLGLILTIYTEGRIDEEMTFVSEKVVMEPSKF